MHTHYTHTHYTHTHYTHTHLGTAFKPGGFACESLTIPLFHWIGYTHTHTHTHTLHTHADVHTALQLSFIHRDEGMGTQSPTSFTHCVIVKHEQLAFTSPRYPSDLTASVVVTL